MCLHSHTKVSVHLAWAPASPVPVDREVSSVTVVVHTILQISMTSGLMLEFAVVAVSTLGDIVDAGGIAGDHKCPKSPYRSPSDEPSADIECIVFIRCAIAIIILTIAVLVCIWILCIVAVITISCGVDIARRIASGIDEGTVTECVAICIEIPETLRAVIDEWS